MDHIATLFTTETPANTNNSDGTPGICPAVTLKFGVAGTIDAIRWYCTTNTGGTWTGYIWEVTSLDASSAAGTQLAAKASGTPTGGAWNNITLDAPGTPTTGAVTIATNKLYRIGVYNDQGRYVNTSQPAADSFVSTKTNGNITAYADNTVNPSGVTVTGTLYQGTFQISSTVNGYPALHFGSANYFIDAVFTASGGATPAPSGIAVTTTLGTPAASNPESAAPSGITAATALGTPTVALNRSAAPTGVAATVALGLPNVSSAPGPSGIAATAALGAPAVTLNLSTAPGGISASTTLGVPTASLLSGSPTGVAATAVLGTPTVSLNRTAVPTGLALVTALGNPSLTLTATPTGIGVAVSAGTPLVSATVPSSSVSLPGSWYGLRSVDEENMRYLKQERGVPTSCPNDGEPLQRNPRTKLYQCSFDGYVWRGF